MCPTVQPDPGGMFRTLIVLGLMLGALSASACSQTNSTTPDSGKMAEEAAVEKIRMLGGSAEPLGNSRLARRVLPRSTLSIIVSISHGPGSKTPT